MNLLTTVLTAFIPFFQYLGKAVVDRTLGPPKPTPTELKAQTEADAGIMQALAQAEGNYKNVSPIIDNIRALQRPVVIAGVLLVWIVLSFAIGLGEQVNPAVYYTVCEIASAVFFYLFGQRTMIYFDNNWFKGLENGQRKQK